MATTLLKLTTIFSLFISIFIAFHTQRALSYDADDDEHYILDAPFSSTRLRSRFLASIKKGTHCDPNNNNVCNGVSANNGTSLLNCCKTHCRNVLGDRNNCGLCGSKCGLGELCCGGTCTNVAYNTTNCGKCGKGCLSGLRCQYGFCGYA
ncbi:hypothetical protein RJ640_004447 [Escallonia rubra]|uniref:Protein GRIM REAPER-like n=1 Tax=Escallonia rubra TaxID=112253 RepID=A0AA88QVE6_9ASTE|nr:hypothetical protein RJ640_004447 [Escallonia rubra]